MVRWGLAEHSTSHPPATPGLGATPAAPLTSAPGLHLPRWEGPAPCSPGSPCAPCCSPAAPRW